MSNEFPRAPRDDEEREAIYRPRSSDFCLAMCDGWSCTRDSGHAGDHVAAMLSRDSNPICHRWPDAAQPDLPSAPRHDAGTGNGMRDVLDFLEAEAISALMGDERLRHDRCMGLHAAVSRLAADVERLTRERDAAIVGLNQPRAMMEQADAVAVIVSERDSLRAQLAAAERFKHSVDCVCGHNGASHREEEGTGAARECLVDDCHCEQFGNVHMALTAARNDLAAASGRYARAVADADEVRGRLVAERDAAVDSMHDAIPRGALSALFRNVAVEAFRRAGLDGVPDLDKHVMGAVAVTIAEIDAGTVPSWWRRLQDALADVARLKAERDEARGNAPALPLSPETQAALDRVPESFKREVDEVLRAWADNKRALAAPAAKGGA